MAYFAHLLSEFRNIYIKKILMNIYVVKQNMRTFAKQVHAVP